MLRTVCHGLEGPCDIGGNYEATELIDLSQQYPKLTKLVLIGKTIQGQDILAIKVTKDAAQLADGTRPSVLYSSTQHAR